MRIQLNFACCWALVLASLALVSEADEWPQWRGSRRDGVWREDGIVEHLPGKLIYHWRTRLGPGFSGPAVAARRVYVMDRIAPPDYVTVNRPLTKEQIEGGERIVCLDARTGDVVWTYQYPCRYNISYPVGPRATPTVADGKVYAVGAMGDLHCLDAESGRVIWQKNYVRDFGARVPFWGFASAPLVDGPRLIALVGGSNGRCVVALNKDTGEMLWHALDAPEPGYSAPIIIRAGGKRQLIVWNPVGIYGLDPQTGRVYWQYLASIREGHSIATPIFDKESGKLFVTSFFDGPIMLRLSADRPEAELLWRGKSHSELPNKTDGLHSIISTPVLERGYIYGVCSYGQFRCLDAQTGKRIWETVKPTGFARWSTAFLVKHKGRFLIFNEHGDLIMADLSPQGYEEDSRVHVIEPTTRIGRRRVVWCHPAFAYRRMFVRNGREIVCVDLAAERY